MPCASGLAQATITLNQGAHWRYDYVTDLVFQEKSYKTNLHLFSAYAEVVWRSVNKNDCSQESILSERSSYMYMVIVIPFFIVTAFHFKFTHCSTSYHIKECVLSIWMIPMTASRKLISTFSNLICSDINRIDKIMCFPLRKTRKMDLSLVRSQKFLYFLINIHLLCLYNEFKT